MFPETGRTQLVRFIGIDTSHLWWLMRCINPKKQLKAKLKWCQNNEQQIKNEVMTQHYPNKSFVPFWTSVNKLNHKWSISANVSEHSQHLTKSLPFGTVRVFGAGSGASKFAVTITTKQVASILKTMVRGKSRLWKIGPAIHLLSYQIIGWFH